ncbi:MAG: ATP-binding protein [Promethearchaeota archaeon]
MSETAPDELYRQLQEHLDKQPVGFPRAEDGSEIRVLKAFFTDPSEARMALCMSAIPSDARSIFRRAKRKAGMESVEETREKLDAMVKKGLIHYWDEPGTGKRLYMLMPLAVGFFEFSVDNLTREQAEAFDQYMGTFVNEYNKFPQMRTIPIDAAITHENEVMAYDDVFKLIEEYPGPFGVAECVCSQEKKLLGHECEFGWTERCMTNSQWYIDEGHAREISKEEAVEIVKKAMGMGLVVQPGNTQHLGFFCLCCKDCCGILTNARKLPKPAQFFHTNFYSEVDPDECSACETCADACPMDAIAVESVAVVDRDRCIGCGVCVAACPAGAIKLRDKEEKHVPPKDLMHMYQTIMETKARRARESKDQSD